MKRIISCLFAFLFALGAVSCTAKRNGDDTGNAVKTDTETVTTEEPELTKEEETKEIITAPDEDEGITACFAHAFVKTDPDAFSDTGMRSYTVYMCRNEYENAQLILSADGGREGVSVEAPVLKNKDGAELAANVTRQYYVKCLDRYYPDAIAPMNETTEKFDLSCGRSQALFIQLKTGKDTRPGDYEGVISVKCDGRTVKQLRLSAHVWDIELPDESSSAAVTGMYTSQVRRFHGDGDVEGYFAKYYDYLLEHRVNGYDLPYDILDARADAYMSDPRVKNFRVPYCPDKDKKLLSYYEKLCKNEEWMKKAFFYPHDEPGTAASLDEMAKKCERLKRLCPGIRIVVPFFQNVQYDKDTDQIGMMDDHVDIWCPKSFCFTKPSDKAKGRRLLYSTAQSKKYPEFGERMAQQVAEGDELWWYVCWEPGLPYLNMYVDMTGLQNRLLFWQQKQYGVNGFLYWSSMYWPKVEDPWESMATVGTDYKTGKKWLSDEVFGDGSLMYPGTKVGVDGPCGSFRLEMIRDGLEEFEMFTMLEKLSGREAVDGIINRVSASIVKFTDSDDDFAQARIALGDALERALKDK